MTDIFPLLFGGLVLFVHAIAMLSQVLQNLFSERAVKTIEKATKNIFRAILTGTLLTILLGSSSAVIILAIIFLFRHCIIICLQVLLFNN